MKHPLTTPQTTPALAPARPTLQRCVLVVDDAIDVLNLLCDTLAQEGYTVLAAKSAKQALQRLELIVPDGILLDAVMPEMDGFTLCQHIKSHPAWQHIPVVFMTGLSESEHIVQGFASGAVDYVVKPLNLPEVLARLATHVKNAQTTRLAQAAVDIAGFGVALLDSQTRLAWLSPQAHAWLQHAMPDTHAAQQWLAQARLTGLALHDCGAQGQLQARYIELEHTGESMLLLSLCPHGTPNQSPSEPPSLRQAALTPREKEVLMWLSKGKTNRDIAEILSMSPRTVNKHLEHIFEKLGVETRTAAAALASQFV